MDITTDGGSVARITIHNAWLWARPLYTVEQMRLMDPPLPPEEE